MKQLIPLRRAIGSVMESLELRQLLSAAYVIDGVQPASYDQPQIHVLFRHTATGSPLIADDGLGDTTFDVTGFLDTGSSGVVISQETAEGLGIQSSTFNGQPVTYADVGIGGADIFDVSEPLYLNFAPFNDTVDGTDEADFSQKFGPLRTQINQNPADPALGDPLDIFGMPAMQGKVVVMDTTPVNDLANMRTWIYNPGTAYHAATTTTDPGIPTTNLHVKLSSSSLKRFTDVLPVGTPGPVFTSNPFVGPAPFASGDTTPPITIGQGSLTTNGSFLLDTGSQSTFISSAMAAKVHVYYEAGTEGTDNPILVDGSGKEIPDQFSLPIGGIGQTSTVPGFYLDSLTLPTREGVPIKFTHAPVLVVDVTLEDPSNGDTFTLDGDIGMNYFVASSAIAGGVGDDHPGDFTWMTFDQPNGVLGLNLPGAVPVLTGSISGNVFSDFNSDGKIETGDKGLASVRVYIDANLNGKFDASEKTVLTDSTGAYHLTGLNPGTYRVREVTPSAYKLIAPAAGYFSVTISAGQDTAAHNFADAPIKAAISGSVFNDISGDVTRQTTDPGLSGWRVYLDTNNNGKLDTGETSVLTNVSGNYSFTGLLPASYVVRDVQQAGWRATTVTSYVVVLAGVNAIGRNFGVTHKAKLSGSVFLDANKNGIRDKAEVGLANWRIYIDTNKNGKFDTGELSALTDSLGNWTFAAISAGTYVVRIVQQAGFTRTAPAAGSFTLVLSNGAIVTGKTFGEGKP